MTAAWLALFVAASPSEASVVYATAERAYFDRGIEAGLAAGAVVRGRVATCTIDQGSRRHASCAIGASPAFAAGERVSYSAVEPTRERDSTRTSTSAGPGSAPNDPLAEARILEVLDTAPYPLIEARLEEIDAEAGRFGKLTAGTAVEAWVYANRDPFLRERVDLALYDLDLGFAGLRGDLELTAILWNVRPAGTRFRPRSGAHLYVHALSVHARSDAQRITGSAGRIRPWHAPGLYLLDGVQLGYRFGDDRALEVGVIAGAPPSWSTLEPQAKRWIAGGYWSYATAAGAFQLLHEGRAGFARGEGDGDFGDLEAQLHASAAELRALFGARATFDRRGLALPSAELAIDAELGGLRLRAEGRTRRDRDALLPVALETLCADRASASLAYEGLRAVTPSLSAGVARLPDEAITRGFAGPELMFDAPQIGVVGVAYQEAFGALPGRAAHAQWIAAPWALAQLFVRLSYLEDRFDAGALRDLALSGQLEAPLELDLGGIELRVEVGARAVLNLSGAHDGRAFSGALRAGLAAAL